MFGHTIEFLVDEDRTRDVEAREVLGGNLSRREQWQQLGSAHGEDGVRVHLLANAPCRETGPIEARLFRFVERFFDERTLAVGGLAVLELDDTRMELFADAHEKERKQ